MEGFNEKKQYPKVDLLEPENYLKTERKITIC